MTTVRRKAAGGRQETADSIRGKSRSLTCQNERKGSRSGWLSFFIFFIFSGKRGMLYEPLFFGSPEAGM
jgi:hypothetical protein